MTDARHTLDQLFESVSLGAPENAVGFVLWRVVHRYQREIDRILAAVDLTHLQFTTLAMAAWIARSDKPATQAAIASAGDIHPMQVSQILKVLERKRMVARFRDPADERAKIVRIEALGVEALRTAMPLVIEVQRAMFGPQGEPGGRLLSELLRISDRGQE